MTIERLCVGTAGALAQALRVLRIALASGGLAKGDTFSGHLHLDDCRRPSLNMIDQLSGGLSSFSSTTFERIQPRSDVNSGSV